MPTWNELRQALHNLTGTTQIPAKEDRKRRATTAP